MIIHATCGVRARGVINSGVGAMTRRVAKEKQFRVCRCAISDQYLTSDSGKISSDLHLIIMHQAQA
jgi:hypothetical protein